MDSSTNPEAEKAIQYAINNVFLMPQRDAAREQSTALEAQRRIYATLATASKEQWIMMHWILHLSMDTDPKTEYVKKQYAIHEEMFRKSTVPRVKLACAHMMHTVKDLPEEMQEEVLVLSRAAIYEDDTEDDTATDGSDGSLTMLSYWGIAEFSRDADEILECIPQFKYLNQTYLLSLVFAAIKHLKGEDIVTLINDIPDIAQMNVNATLRGQVCLRAIKQLLDEYEAETDAAMREMEEEKQLEDGEEQLWESGEPAPEAWETDELDNEAAEDDDDSRLTTAKKLIVTIMQLPDAWTEKAVALRMMANIIYRHGEYYHAAAIIKKALEFCDLSLSGKESPQMRIQRQLMEALQADIAVAIQKEEEGI